MLLFTIIDCFSREMTSEEDIVEATKSDGVSFDGLENPAQNKDDYEELHYPELPSPDLECPDSGTFNPIVRFNFENCGNYMHFTRTLTVINLFSYRCSSLRQCLPTC